MPPDRITHRPSFIVTAFCMVLMAVCSLKVRAEEYGFDTWTTANGLPQNTVTGVVQTPDGYLWISTFDGLARFDGVRFTIFDRGNSKGIVNNRFSRLFADRKGVIYAVTEDSVVTVYRNGGFVSYSSFATTAEPIAAIEANEGGDPVFETEKGFYILDNGQFIRIRERDPNIKKIYWGKSGAKWIIGRETTTCTKAGRETSYSQKLTNEELAASSFLTIHEDRNGALWIARQLPAFELWRLRDGKIDVFTKKEIPSLAELFPRNIKEDADGTIWFLFSGILSIKPNQLVRYREGVFTTFKIKDAAGPTSGITDREGNLWLATTTGLRRLRRDIITTLSEKDGLNSNEVYPLIQRSDGEIFIGTVKGVNRYRDGKIADADLKYNSLSGPLYMRGFWEDSQKRLWLGYQGEGGFGRITGISGLMTVGKDQLPSGATDFASDSEGNIWVATDEGLYKYKDDEKIAHYTAEEGLPSGRIVTLHFDKGGTLWLGTFDGLAQFTNGRFRSFNTEPDCPQGIVRSIYEDAEGVLWIGTYGDGLVRYKNEKFHSYRVKDGLFNNGVFAILEDDAGNFWMSSNRGIHTAAKSELNDLADGKISKLNSTSYDEKDGMINAECNGGRIPAAFKAKDGKLWFSTMGGVAIVDPNAEKVNTEPPPVVIENSFIDRKAVDPQKLAAALRESNSAIELDAGQSNIAFEYTGLSLTKAAQTKFRYRLEGLEENWVDAGTRRSVDYSYLPAGSYTFRVIAANANGVWNDTGAAVRIVIKPYFYQTWWFGALLALAVVFVVWWFYYTNVARLRQIAEAKTHFSRQLIESQEAERKRIGSELHDGLGQNLVIIKNRAMLGLSRDDDPARVAAELNSISESASQALEEVREITNNLRPQLLDRLGLTKAINAMLKKVAGVIEIESEIDTIDGLFDENEEISIYRIVQESVNNIIKHSNASNAAIRIKRETERVSIRIEDNGKGFETANVNEARGNLGLVGIKERTQLLKGQISIDSKPGEGTTISVVIPTAKNK